MFPSGSKCAHVRRNYLNTTKVKSIATTFNPATSSTPKSDLAAPRTIQRSASVDGTLGFGSRTHIITLTQPPGPQNASPSGRRVIFTPLSSDKQILDPISFNRVERIGKLQKYPKYHCGMDAVKFALQRCEGAGFVTEYDKIASL